MSATYVPSRAVEIRYDDSTTALGATDVQGAIERLRQGGSGDKTYVHFQLNAASVWVVTHNLGKFPSVDTFDSADTPMFGIVHHVSANQSTISFFSSGIPVAMGGYATFN